MELKILEYVTALCMGLSIARPLVRGLWKLPGLAVCPFIALGIVAGIFPAYGFRPECVPLLLFAIFLFFVNLPDLWALFSDLHGDTYRDKGLIFTLGTSAAFIFVMWITLSFSPLIDDNFTAEGVKTTFLNEGKLQLRIYGEVEQNESSAEDAGETHNQDKPSVIMILADEAAGADTAPTEAPPGRPLLILAPPVAGSVTVSDAVCAALRDRGFTVLGFSRVNFDSPFFDENGKPVRLSVPGVFRLAGALTRGTENTAGNARGRRMEEIRKQDILFLLKELSVNKSLLELLGDTDTNTIYLAGYGAGGAALTTLAGDDTFTAQFPQARGIVAIEAPILSSLESDPVPPPPPPATNPFTALFRNAGLFIKNNSARKITHITNIPRPRLPCLFVVSDRVTLKRSGHYETILSALEQSQGPSLLAAVPGAGPFDYSSSPEYYPLFSALFRGIKQPKQKHDWPALTAAIISNFAILIDENEAAKTQVPTMNDTAVPGEGMTVNTTPGGKTQPEVSSFKTHLTKTALDTTIYLEQGGVWHIPDVRTILEP